MKMPFYTLTGGGVDYRLCFAAAAVVAAEEKLGQGLLSVLSDQNQLLQVGTQVVLLHAALQKYQHGIKMTDVCDLYDEILAEANGTGIQVVATALMGAMEASGFIPPSATAEAAETKPEQKKTNSKKAKAATTE